jgi:hypothetical protein
MFITFYIIYKLFKKKNSSYSTDYLSRKNSKKLFQETLNKTLNNIRFKLEKWTF